MKARRILIFTAVFLMVTLVFSSMAWANPNKKIPPGLQKREELPPGLAKMNPLPYGLSKKGLENLASLIVGKTEGTILMVKEIANATWVVIETEKELQTYKLNRNQSFKVGDVVRVEYLGNQITSIQLVESKEAARSSLRYTFTATPNRPVIGDNISFRLNVQNPGDKDLVRSFNSSQQFDIVIKDGDNKVWQWSDDQNFLTVIQDVTFEAGKRVQYTANWKPTKAGEYRVEAYFLGENRTRPVAIQTITVQERETILNYGLHIDPRSVTVNNEVKLLLSVTNENANEYIKTLNSGQVYDFIIKKDGVKVWQWSDSRGFTMALQDISIKADELVVISAEWTPTATGDYTVEAYFLAEGSRPVAKGSFKVTR